MVCELSPRSEGITAMAFWGSLCLLCVLLEGAAGGRKMPKLADRKLCADEECSHPISIAVALADYIPPDCRFIPIRRGQIIYIFSKLRGQGRLFWSGSVEGDYGESAARLGYFPSSIVQEEHYLMAGKVEVKTDPWDFSCP